MANTMREIPVDERFKDKLLSDPPQMSCLTLFHPYSLKGDLFEAFGRKFRVITIRDHDMLYVLQNLYTQNGFSDRKAMIKHFAHVPPYATVYCHFFMPDEYAHAWSLAGGEQYVG